MENPSIMIKKPAARDIVDDKLQIWEREIPELDVATEGIVERIQKLARAFDHSMDETLAGYGVTIGEWKLLCSLRNQGAPYRLTPGQLSTQLGLSSGAMTNRLDRLERAALVRRLPDPSDRRSVQVELTDAGWSLWQGSVGVQATKERLLAASLDEAEKTALNDLLRRLMLAFGRVSKHTDPVAAEKDATPSAVAG
jgi:DNA-binding MarR family transcriptional regulator